MPTSQRAGAKPSGAFFLSGEWRQKLCPPLYSAPAYCAAWQRAPAPELRTRGRQRKLIAKIDAAVGRIEDGNYGYCEETGEPIGVRLLDAHPIATLSLDAQERHERREKVYRVE